jgi:hypothetical protein
VPLSSAKELEPIGIHVDADRLGDGQTYFIADTGFLTSDEGHHCHPRGADRSGSSYGCFFENHGRQP